MCIFVIVIAPVISLSNSVSPANGLKMLLCDTDVPDPPVELTLSDRKDRSVRLHWAAASDHNSPITGKTPPTTVLYCQGYGTNAKRSLYM